MLTIRGKKGFTLIEVMVVCAILAILASIAVFSYSDSVEKSRRRDAQAALMGLAQAMERHLTSTGSYEGAAVGGADTGEPLIFHSTTPVDGSQTFYNLQIHAVTATSYTLKAIPANGQAGDGLLALWSNGQRGWAKGNDSADPDAIATTELCWDC